GFAMLVDPENLHLVAAALDPPQAMALYARLGDLRMYHPANPTGSWQLLLSHPVQAAVARRLLVGYIQQHDQRLCSWPHHVCFTQCLLGEQALDVKDPHTLTLPKSGMLKINFVDLRPVPDSARPLSPAQLRLLVNILLNDPQLDGRK
ncbi:uncharacterized protein HaLaN_21417, partial [Haematococcus lacustris]